MYLNHVSGVIKLPLVYLGEGAQSCSSVYVSQAKSYQRVCLLLYASKRCWSRSDHWLCLLAGAL